MQEAPEDGLAMESESRFEGVREGMARTLEAEIRDQRVLDAFSRVPRERFVPHDIQRYAYDDRPLPIGYGQTISQPLIVAIMLQALNLTGDEKVLEIGTGSGYQAALLSLLARDVASIERVPALASQAKERLRSLGYNVRVFEATDQLGWPQEAPYDAIAVAAGAPAISRALLDQLALNGRLLIPVGGRRIQQLVRATNTDRGVTLERLGECRFVPLISPREGWPELAPVENGARPP